MLKKILLYIILVTIACRVFSANASAEIIVGVREDMFIEYNIESIGIVPDEHDVDKAKIEII